MTVFTVIFATLIVWRWLNVQNSGFDIITPNTWTICMKQGVGVRRPSLTHASASSALPQVIHPHAPDGKYPGH